MADMLEVGGYKEVGYQYIIIDDCWLDHTRDKVRSKKQFKNLIDATFRSSADPRGIIYIYDVFRSKHTLFSCSMHFKAWLKLNLKSYRCIDI